MAALLLPVDGHGRGTDTRSPGWAMMLTVSCGLGTLYGRTVWYSIIIYHCLSPLFISFLLLLSLSRLVTSIGWAGLLVVWG